MFIYFNGQYLLDLMEKGCSNEDFHEYNVKFDLVYFLSVFDLCSSFLFHVKLFN